MRAEIPTPPSVTLFDFVPDAIKKNTIRDLADLNRSALASLLMPKPHHPGQFHSVGTGFYVVWPDNPDIVRLVTAAHVLEEFDFDVGHVTIGGLRIALSDVGQRNLDLQRDIAVWSIPASCFLNYRITDVEGFPLWHPGTAQDKFIRTDSFLIAGYPASRNKVLDFRQGREPNRQILAMALHTPPVLVDPGILRFSYSGEVVTESWGPKIQTPRLQGMSGSPCLRIVVDRVTRSIGLVLSGVFTERDKNENTLSIGWFGDPWQVPTSL